MHAVIAADGHVARLQQHMVPQGEARFKAAVGAEIELQQALLGQEVPGHVLLVQALHLHLVVERGHLPV